MDLARAGSAGAYELEHVTEASRETGRGLASRSAWSPGWQAAADGSLRSDHAQACPSHIAASSESQAARCQDFAHAQVLMRVSRAMPVVAVHRVRKGLWGCITKLTSFAQQG